MKVAKKVAKHIFSRNDPDEGEVLVKIKRLLQHEDIDEKDKQEIVNAVMTTGNTRPTYKRKDLTDRVDEMLASVAAREAAAKADPEEANNKTGFFAFFWNIIQWITCWWKVHIISDPSPSQRRTPSSDFGVGLDGKSKEEGSSSDLNQSNNPDDRPSSGPANT